MNDALPRVVLNDEENGVRVVEAACCGHDYDWHSEEHVKSCKQRYKVEVSYGRDAMNARVWETIDTTRSVARETSYVVRALIELVDSLQRQE